MDLVSIPASPIYDYVQLYTSTAVLELVKIISIGLSRQTCFRYLIPFRILKYNKHVVPESRQWAEHEQSGLDTMSRLLEFKIKMREGHHYKDKSLLSQIWYSDLVPKETACE